MKSIELLAFDKHQNLQFEGKCKIRIDRLSSLLLIEPINEEYKMISAVFKWKYVIAKNILFVFGEHESNDFALVFDEEIRCKKVYNFIFKDEVKNDVEKEILYKRFWIPLCNKIVQKDDSSNDLKNIVKQWINSYDGEEKEEYINLLKDYNVYDIVFSSMGPSNIIKNIQTKKKNLKVFGFENFSNSRKRRHNEMVEMYGEYDMSDECDHQLPISENENHSTSNFTKIVDQTKFKFVNYKTKFYLLRKLLIFITTEKVYCFEYSWAPRRNVYFCSGCRDKGKRVAAIFDKDENGLECIKMEEKEHICNPIPYIPEKYIEMKIFKKADYKILENCNVKSGKLLIIFDGNKKCWEFQMFKKETHAAKCRYCHSPAKLWNEGTEDEYLELRNANHKCKSRPYDLKKYYEFKNFILSSDFEVKNFVKNGEEKKMLIIFDSKDQNFCYIYYSFENKFYCRGCGSRRKQVTAKIFQNDDGENYVILSKSKHICELKLYTEAINVIKQIILYLPDFELTENIKNGKKQLLIFHSNNQNLCYKYTSSGYKNIYQCSGCHYVLSKTDRDYTKTSRAKLCTNKNGECVVQLNHSAHICKPKKYENRKIIRSYDYFLIQIKNTSKPVNIALYHPEDKKLCYIFIRSRYSELSFKCQKCAGKGKTVTIRVEKDDDGREFFWHDYQKHICEPIKVSSIYDTKVERIDFFKEKEMPKIDEVDEKNILKHPDFELRPNNKGIANAVLFVLHKENQNLGYKYWYVNNKYVCCRKRIDRCHADATLQNYENDEKYIILGKNEHKCKPKEYDLKQKIIQASDFLTVPQENNKILIIIFTTPTRDECYEYGQKAKNNFVCLGCKINGKYNSAMLCTDENNYKFLLLSNNEHICIPKKYIKEKCEKNVIPAELFELHRNANGVENKKLIIFTSNQKDFVHEYSWHHKNSYRCPHCSRMKKSVLVKLVEKENGQKYVELGIENHICKPRKYNPKKYVQLKTLSNELFEFHGNDDRNLIIFTSDKKEYFYHFIMEKIGYYRCKTCKSKRHTVNAKVNENNCVTLSYQEHVCQAQKYDPKKIKWL